ncbi:urease accessory protein UreD [Rhizobium leguminosarum]|uniref:Urease accessory protein UreD n=1 Tax=Rhizobium leguminosarum bv. trifolii (strain WSM1325) TaxID=395491 RepID=C6AUJ0_RHILS|nr:urease accessory protein UreD [Rhizobium leguminosarum]ACS57560.1 Urease accessory protein UreD [Rhizobium leguminosarum bv. trifolii WSM1325]MBY2909382.1 urease accessory protein UreD [Rhizobium leguminosarum]MBY2924262.1 urease accessory protein UreD [Rhizobium leguminosarum]MBY2949612.1 urease accessory protein UreD [Rhizobium leguminosarum]MBY2985515.1 urease accessory protein UreD [Rhizobium leguminosarum]
MTIAAAGTRPQRAEGRGHLAAKLFDGRTRIRELYQEGAAKIRLPDTFDASMEAVIINTAGGLTGGDRMDWSVDAGPGTRIDVTTQACEKIYKASAGIAEVATSIKVGAQARVDWLPQETILFDRAALFRRLDVDLDESAEFLAVEAVLLGRKAMGEAVVSGLFRDRWRIRRSGQLIHAEELRLSEGVAALAARRAVLGGQVAFATLLYAGPLSEAYLSKVRPLVEGSMGGASAWNGKLVVRLAAADGFSLRKILIPVISALRNGAPVPKVWNL